MATDKNETASDQPLSDEKNGAKKLWITPQLEEYDPNTVTRTGFSGFGADSGIYS